LKKGTELEDFVPFFVYRLSSRQRIKKNAPFGDLLESYLSNGMMMMTTMWSFVAVSGSMSIHFWKVDRNS
jgi:hypothetical protein